MSVKVAFITGASSGIGYATALAFAKKGIHVTGTARRTERLEALRQAVASLPEPHGDFLGITADVTDADALQKAVQQTVQKFGRLDILVANAGVGHRGTIADSDWQDIETLLRINMDGVLYSIRAAVPAMRKAGGGHIITISSVAYNLISPYAAIYAASKAFVTSIANSLRIELEPDNIRVTDFLVGRTQTEFNEKRLGGGKRPGSGLPTMPAEKVANAIVATIGTNKKTVTLRLFDRLMLLGNILIPSIMGRLARRQYR